LCGQPLRRGLSSYYRGGDRLFRLKDELEKYLTDQERNLFKLTEKYYFFDLTNTYFEGQCLKNNKAAYGRSKEKRNDCKQVTLGLCVDELGFAKCSRLFEGNRNETTTLADMVNGLEKNSNGLKADIQRTVVMDAGIASEANISWLREQGYRYIVVNRGANHFPVDIGAMERIKHDDKKGIDIRIKRFASEGEAFILCWSRKKERKETGIRSRLEDLFVSKLQHLREGLQKPNRTKRYEKVVEAVGRLKEKYAKAAKLYSVEVSADNESTPKRLAVDLLWEKREPLHSDEVRREGSYVLRTDRTDMTDKEIWETYIMLRQIEYSFLCMKSYLGLRPNFHRLECRMDTHMFISVLAYHFLHVIEHRLRMNGDTRKWATVRGILKTHQRITVNFTEKTPEGTMVRRGIRLNTHAEDAQREIYHSLGLSAEPLPRYQASYDAETGKSVVRKK
jgi:transposase